MSLVRVVAIEPFDGHQPGARIDVSESQARELQQLGLVKMQLGAPANKSMQPVQENKAAGPLPAAGAAAQSSASPAGRVSQPQTRTSSPRGGKKPQARGRRSR